MAKPAHDRVTLAHFQGGEERLVYARYRDRPDESLYFLEDGRAGEVRLWAKEHLECFLPECRDRWLTTVARRAKRDGFMHRKGAGGHAPEGLFHAQGKALIERWVREQYPDVQVGVEQSTKSKQRRADVMLTWPDGAQVAVEVQYAAIPPEEWQRRHDSYREQGIEDVWLFGHIPPHLRQSRPPADHDIALLPVHYAVLEADVPLLWMNPILELVGTAWQTIPIREGHAARVTEYDVPPAWNDLGAQSGKFEHVPLSTCLLSPAGLMFPFLEQLAGAKKRMDEVLAHQKRARLAREEAERAREAKRQQILAEAARKETEQQARFQPWWDAREPAWLHQWEASQDHAWLVERYGCVPDLISTRLDPFGGVLAYHEYWHTIVYRALVWGKNPGESWSVRDVREALAAAGIELHPTNPDRVKATLLAYMHHLTAAGHVTPVPADRANRHIMAVKKREAEEILRVRVVGDIDRVARARAEEESKQRAAQRRADQLEEERVQRARAQDALLSPSPAATVRPTEHHERHIAWLARVARARAAVKTASVSTPVRTVRAGLMCSACGGKLDPVFTKIGHHLGC